MRPQNQFTSANNRFFYPANNPVEYHGSLDISGLPQAEHIAGSAHHVVVERSDGQECAFQLTSGSTNIPAGSVVKQVAAAETDYFNSPQVSARFVDTLEDQDQSLRGHEKESYIPPAGSQMIVLIDMQTRSHQMHSGDNFMPEDGFMIVPADEPLPTKVKLGIDQEEEVRYALFGFIEPNDKLVLPEVTVPSPTAKVIDWYVINSIAKNTLEQKLLFTATAAQGRLELDASARINPTVATYLRYFDAKHGTTFFELSERDAPVPKRRPLTPAQSQAYWKAVDTANRFLHEPRYPNL